MLTTEGVVRIGEERVRQIEGEGHDSLHDKQHTGGELAQAAACYLMVDPEPIVRLRWPWAPVRFKRESFPTPSARDIEKGGALAAAEWDRQARVKRELAKPPHC